MKTCWMTYRTPVDLSTQKAEAGKSGVQGHPPPQEFKGQPELKELASKNQAKTYEAFEDVAWEGLR